jgi:spore maturation protein CgeB
VRAALPDLDMVLTYGGGPPVIDAYRGFGAAECVPIYNALDPATHHPVPRDPAYACDVGFLGNRLPDREARVEEFFFRAASLSPERRFVLGGEGWGDRGMPANVTYLGHVPTHRHNTVNASARLVLNIHRESMIENGWSPATRMFEAAGSGSCQVTDAMPGIGDFFTPGEEILVAEDGAAVARIVAATTDADARRIGEAGRRRALADHTYAQRAERMDAILRAPVGSPA